MPPRSRAKSLPGSSGATPPPAPWTGASPPPTLASSSNAYTHHFTSNRLLEAYALGATLYPNPYPNPRRQLPISGNKLISRTQENSSFDNIERQLWTEHGRLKSL